MGDTSSVLSIWSSLSTKIKQFVGDMTKSAVRKKKMNIYSIDTVNQTVTVYESSNPTVLITVPYRVESAISRMSAGQSVMVEWTYDDFSTAVAVAPGKGWATLAEVQEAIGTGGGSGDYYTLSINGRTITLVGTASSSSSVTVPDTDLSNYYTKSQANTLLSGKADTATTLAGYGITNAYTKDTVDTLLLAKADTATTLAGYGIADAYTKTQVDTALSAKAPLASPTFTGTPNAPTAAAGTNTAQIATTAFVQTAISSVPAIDAYTKSEVNALLDDKADKATTLAGYGITNAYTSSTVDTLLLAKADTATTLAGYGITDAYTKTQVDSALSGKQNTLTFDSTPTQGSTNPVTSGGVYSAISNIPAIDAYTKTETNALLAGKQNTLTFDSAPTSGSTNPVTSGGVYDALSNIPAVDAYTKTETNALLAGKQNTLTFDTEPTALSLNPVTSAGLYDTFDSVYSQIDAKQAKLTFDSAPTQNSTNPVTSGGVYTALGNKANSATTLSGYGITDAYTKTETDGLFLPLTGGTISGPLYLNAPLNMGNSDWIYGTSADGTKKYALIGVNNNDVIGIGASSRPLRIHNSTDIAVDNPASWRTALGSDSAPTSGSTNFVESGGVYDALAEKMQNWDLVWSNPSITSAFSAQTLSPSFEGYDFYLLIYGLSNTSPNNRMSMFLRVGEQSSMSFASWYGSSTLAVTDRSFYFTNNQIHFNDCTRHVSGQSSSATYNNGAIPQRIYGIKNS